jgi:hypothetical protein
MMQHKTNYEVYFKPIPTCTLPALPPPTKKKNQLTRKQGIQSKIKHFGKETGIQNWLT